uniref:Uncharacterized protein n=1 Tax=Cacopsylla melanoneura TaxID=428564 RepID=A0A8D8TPT8_9HEMI
MRQEVKRIEGVLNIIYCSQRIGIFPVYWSPSLTIILIPPLHTDEHNLVETNNVLSTENVPNKSINCFSAYYSAIHNSRHALHALSNANENNVSGITKNLDSIKKINADEMTSSHVEAFGKHDEIVLNSPTNETTNTWDFKNEAVNDPNLPENGNNTHDY